jgi:anti-sigma B factor antagonist
MRSSLSTEAHSSEDATGESCQGSGSGAAARMVFEVHTREIGRVVMVEAAGRFTLTDGRTQLRDVIHVFASSGTKRFILNLARVEFIDSYGIGELARSFSVVRQAGGALKLASVSPRVLEVLAISRLNTIFDIYPDDHAAFEAFAHQG